MVKKILTVAGSDAGGGAGIQADLKTFEEYGTFGLSSITSILTVSPKTKKPSIYPIPIDIVEKQLETALSGGALDALKIGLLGSLPVVDLLEKSLTSVNQTRIVLDPVMAVKTNKDVLQPELVHAMIQQLIPLADIITPNLVEACILAQMTEITTENDMMTAAKRIHDLGAKSVIIKGGARFPGNVATDLYYDGKHFDFIHEDKLTTTTNHGAGCSFAASITAGLAKGLETKNAVKLAKYYVTSAIKNGIFLNDFTGYVWHGAYLDATKRMNLGDDYHD